MCKLVFRKIRCIALLLFCAATATGKATAAGALCDYNGDSQSDLAVFAQDTGAWFVRDLSGSVLLWNFDWGGPGFSAVPGDYDGDGLTDLAVYNRTSGVWFIVSMNSNVILWAFPWGGAGLVPVPGDYDGDHVDDLALYSIADGAWFIASVTGAVIAFAELWGGAGLVPVPGDYNGDACSDLTVYGAGAWYSLALDGRILFFGVPWGGDGLVPVPGDYNGDSASDLAVYSPNNGTWYVLSTNLEILAWAFLWGGPGLQPVPGDWDGDGMADFAVYSEAMGLWFIRSYNGSVLSWGGAWGGPGLLPVPVFAANADPVLAELGTNANFNGRRFFPDDNPWNQRIDNEPVDPRSDILIAGIGADRPLHPDFGADWNGAPFGMPYLVVSGSEPPVRINYTDYGDESDPGPFPVPLNAPLEPGDDRHVLVVDRDNWVLYELFDAWPVATEWMAAAGARFDLNSNVMRPQGWTSADAAGLPVLPGLVRYDEVCVQGEIRHALRFTCRRTRRAYVYPARHYASSETSPDLPPMGMRVRLKANVDISGFPHSARVILQCLKTYGMFLADNGSDWFVSGVADARWNDQELNTLKALRGSDFEVVRMGEIVVGTTSAKP